jgi:hypothetical protein
MWEINEYEVISIGRTPGGNRFTEFVDSLIFAEAYVNGLRPSEIRTNLRTNLPDGGVDTEVLQPISNDSTGWLSDAPTIWQYKAKGYSAKKDGTDLPEATKNELKLEINKRYSSDCIKNGYAYRLCICDSLPANVQKMIEIYLNEESHLINPAATNAKVLSAGSLAEWASRFPALKLRHILPVVTSLGSNFDAWGSSVIAWTHEFVNYPTAEDISQKIQNHVDFTKAVNEAVISISGLAGVGKTRLVYESLLACDGAKHLSICTDEEKDAIKIVRTILNDLKAKAILIADECGLSTRYRLNELLKGHRNRVRVIAIDNSGERPASSSPEIWLEEMPKEITKEILDKNYPMVPIGRRRAYSDLAEGFVRFAAYLCSKDNLIASAGCVDPVHSGIRDYILKEGMLSSEELKVIQALSLVTKVGYKDDVSQELVELCSIVNLEPKRFKEVANNLHDTSGFVARAGRYYYVTPEIVAQVGFDLSWNNLAKEDPQEFLEKLPKILLKPFLTRVRKSSSIEVRGIIGEFFRKWSFGLGPAQLNSVDAIDRLVTLIEVEPGAYLQVLRRLIEQATIDELKMVSGEYNGGSYGPRRSIVWLAERIAAFPEYFDDAENILLKLGLAETEKNISNNATTIWKQLYRILLSGTAIPFLDRLSKLKKRIFSGNEAVSCFAMGAFDEILSEHLQRVVGPSIIAGKIPPEEYAPNDAEYVECISSTILLLHKIIDRENISEKVTLIAKSVLVNHTRGLLNQGRLNELETTLSKEILDDNLKICLIESIEEFLYFDLKEKWGRPAIPEDYAESVKGWLLKIKPSDFKGRIKTLVGTYRGHYLLLDERDKLDSEVKALASECLANPDNLMQVREAIFSSDARNAFTFGYGLGKLDERALFLDFVFESSIQYESTELGRGYLSGLLGDHPIHVDLANRKLNEIQVDYPALAYELFMARIEVTCALDRTLELVDLGKLDASLLGRFAYGRGMNQLSLSDFERILIKLAEAYENGNSMAAKSALEFVSFRIRNEKDGCIEPILERENIRSLAWRLVEITPDEIKSYEWTQIVEALSVYDPNRAARIVVLGLVDGSLLHLGEFAAFFASLARKYPELVMQRIGEVMLDEKLGWKFQIYEFRSFFKAIPDEIIINWVKEHGINGARLLARHLPIPYISESGAATVPFLTQFILDTFDDDEVFNGFICGVHAFQLYSGDIASQHDEEAEVAHQFLSHPSTRIRKWAQIEEENAHSMSKRERQFMEERGLD